ncbi:MAG TPA: hypothetical protein VM076_01565 [Gemmatimonadaceae bacterium]|nr:hypothetical protein [Gemmatimonadaceae bacterium]
MVFVLIAMVAAYFMRDRWMPFLPKMGSSTRATTEDGPAWQPVSDEGAARARRAVESLGRRTGPVFVNLAAGDLASYFYIALSEQLPPSADSIEARTVGNRLYVRAVIALDDFKAAESLGPLAGMLGRRERLQMGGTFAIIKPGLAQFLVEDVRLGELPIPRGAIPKLLKQIRRGTRPEGLAENGLPFVVPAYLGDARVAGENVTLYKAAAK